MPRKDIHTIGFCQLSIALAFSGCKDDNGDSDYETVRPEGAEATIGALEDGTPTIEFTCESGDDHYKVFRYGGWLPSHTLQVTLGDVPDEYKGTKGDVLVSGTMRLLYYERTKVHAASDNWTGYHYQFDAAKIYQAVHPAGD